jgi:hypothetical protein
MSFPAFGSQFSHVSLYQESTETGPQYQVTNRVMEDSTLEPLFVFIAYSVSTIQRSFNALPGSAVIARYVKSSHQNDPFRTILEAILVIFAIRTLLQSRTRSDTTGKHFIKFTANVRTLDS